MAEANHHRRNTDRADGLTARMYDRSICTMSRISNRDKLLDKGLQVVLQRGYVGASVRDIVEAAGVPQGSFTNHFASKEAFSLEVLELYFADSCVMMRDT